MIKAPLPGVPLRTESSDANEIEAMQEEEEVKEEQEADDTQEAEEGSSGGFFSALRELEEHDDHMQCVLMAFPAAAIWVMAKLAMPLVVARCFVAVLATTSAKVAPRLSCVRWRSSPPQD